MWQDHLAVEYWKKEIRHAGPSLTDIERSPTAACVYRMGWSDLETWREQKHGGVNRRMEIRTSRCRALPLAPTYPSDSPFPTFSYFTSDFSFLFSLFFSTNLINSSFIHWTLLGYTCINTMVVKVGINGFGTWSVSILALLHMPPMWLPILCAVFGLLVANSYVIGRIGRIVLRYALSQGARRPRI